MQDKIIANKEHMNIVIAGHVDHGKSTVIGRLLADTDSLPQGKLDSIRAYCQKNSRPFEYAFLLDALKDEQSQGITIDSARVFFKTDSRYYIIIDAPGHIEFLKNMVSGASRAEAALLVIDAYEGIKENSRRHCFMISMLGIRQIVVLINKMDLVSYDECHYNDIVSQYKKFLKEIEVDPVCFIPVSGREGDNIAFQSENTPWYRGITLLAVLDGLKTEAKEYDKPLRMPVQDIYKFTNYNDNRRIVAGTIETGSLSEGDTVIFYPSGKRSRVLSIESFNTPPIKKADAGNAIGFTLEEQIYVSRGEVATNSLEEKPKISSRFRANLFWLSKVPLAIGKEYIFKLCTARLKAKVEEIIRVIDASDLSYKKENNRFVERHGVAECIIKLNKAAAFDENQQNKTLSRFVLVEDFDIRGGGIITEALEDKQEWLRHKVMLRNYKWERSRISREERAERYNQKATLIMITGKRGAGKKPVAKHLEAKLFSEGKIVYFIGIGNILYGVDADIKGKDNNRHKYRQEHIRRLSEVAHLMLDSGIILIVTAVELTQEDMEIIKVTVDPDNIVTVWLGDEVSTNISCDICIDGRLDQKEAAIRIKETLIDRGVIYKPW